GGNDDSVFLYDWKEGVAAPRGRWPLARKAKAGKPGTRYPAGLALSPDGKRLYVAENLAGSLAVIDTAGGAVVQDLPVGPLPYGVVVAPDGSVWVSAWGAPTIVSFAPDGAGGLMETGRATAGRHPSALALSADGSRLYAASASTDRVVE